MNQHAQHDSGQLSVQRSTEMITSVLHIVSLLHCFQNIYSGIVGVAVLGDL